MAKSKVYFLKDLTKLEAVTQEQLKKNYNKEKPVFTKIHFGEPGNKTALHPKDIGPIIKALKSQELEPVLIDTPVMYPSKRNTVEGYTKVAQERGYDNLAKILISNTPVEVKTKDFTAGVCKELYEAENVLVITHVKGHPCSGFGGAIKNFGMGGVTRETKAIEHNLSKPVVKKEECVGCGICQTVCPAKAIVIKEGKAVVNKGQCWGCSICEMNCPQDCLTPQKAMFDDLLAQGAAAVINNVPENTIYINLVTRITKWCDCEEDSGDIIANDVGVLLSKNPVAVDKASVDLVRKYNNNENVFKKANNKDPLLHVEFAKEYTKFGMEYELVEM